MADKKISELTAATSVNTTDLMILVQGASTNKVDIDTFFAGVPRRVVVSEASEAPASGALATNKLVSKVASATGTTNYTLASGTHGMEKIIVCSSMAGTDAVVTVTGGVGVTTITFNGAGDSVHLRNIDASWYVISSNSVVIA